MFPAIGAVGIAAITLARSLASKRQEDDDAALAKALQQDADASLAASLQKQLSVALDDTKAMLTALGVAFSPVATKSELETLLLASSGRENSPKKARHNIRAQIRPPPPPRAASAAGRVIALKRGTPRQPHYVPLCQHGESGVGCWEPAQVPPAVAACWLRHAEALGGRALAARWAALAAGYVAPAGSCTAPFVQKRGFTLAKVDEDGDCFYSSVVHALRTIGVDASVAALREVVASQLTADHLEIARVDPADDLERHLGSLEAYQARVRESGGAWADDFAMACVRAHLGLAAILLIDVEAPTKAQKYERLHL